MRELKSMLEQGILVERTSGKQRELCINPALKHLASDSTDTTTSDSGDTDASDSTDTYIKKDIKEIYKENNTSHLHVTALFLKEYDSNIKEYIDDTLTTYYAMYLERKKEEHPKLKRDQLQRIYEWMERVILDYGDIDDMIEEFFNTVKKTDHNINHFCTDGMIQILVDRCK